jgi:hypothetical protein
MWVAYKICFTGTMLQQPFFFLLSAFRHSVASSIEVFIDEKYYIKASDVIVADGISDLQSALPISQSDSVLRESSLESELLELSPTKAISSMSCRRDHSGDF